MWSHERVSLGRLLVSLGRLLVIVPINSCDELFLRVRPSVTTNTPVVKWNILTLFIMITRMSDWSMETIVRSSLPTHRDPYTFILYYLIFQFYDMMPCSGINLFIRFIAYYCPCRAPHAGFYNEELIFAKKTSVRTIFGATPWVSKPYFFGTKFLETTFMIYKTLFRNNFVFIK